jgi:hypothetical protein
MVDFSGWDMPLFYEGIIPEHRAVRQAAGMFDVSHMGEFRIRGGEAEAYLDRMVTNRVAGMADGQALYTALCYENGGAVDDLIVYRLAPGDYTMVVNASNIEKDFAWLVEHRIPGVELENVSEETALLAVQGPRSAELVALAAGAASADIAYYHFRRMSVFGVEATVARLGYTSPPGSGPATPSVSRPVSASTGTSSPPRPDRSRRGSALRSSSTRRISSAPRPFAGRRRWGCPGAWSELRWMGRASRVRPVKSAVTGVRSGR